MVELKKMIKDQAAGAAKDELQKVLQNAEKHVEELTEHVSQGDKLVAQKQKELEQIQDKLGHAHTAVTAKAKEIKI